MRPDDGGSTPFRFFEDEFTEAEADAGEGCTCADEGIITDGGGPPLALWAEAVEYDGAGKEDFETVEGKPATAEEEEGRAAAGGLPADADVTGGRGGAGAAPGVIVDVAVGRA